MQTRRDLLVTVIAVIGLAVVLVVVSGPPADVSALVIPEDDVPQGVSAWEVEGRRVFVVREGDALRAFLGYATHLENEAIWWCPTRDAFVASTHGEAYDTSGRILDGPASRSLDALRVGHDGGNIVIAPDPVVTGQPADEPSARSDQPWQTIEGPAFCPSPLR